jgi:DNA replicative helicase MCM subunit Mcm2 (Cdc46/Mcm family)
MFFKKYVLYAMRHCNPIVTETKCKALSEFFDKVKNLNDKKSTITLRQMEALIRLTAAHAKMRLAEYATAKDAEFAIQLFKDMYKLFGWDVDAGEAPDIQAIFESGMTMNAQDRRGVLLQTIRMAIKLNGTRTIMKSLIKDSLIDQEIFTSEDEFDSFMMKLISMGDVFTPKTIDIDGLREELIGII